MNKKTVYSATAQMLKRMVIDVVFRCIFVRIVVDNSKVDYALSNVSATILSRIRYIYMGISYQQNSYLIVLLTCK